MRRKIDGLGPQILQQERHPAKRPLWQSRPDGGAGLVLLHQHHRIQRGVQGLDAGKGRVEQLIRHYLALGHQGGKAGGVMIVIVRDDTSP